MEPYAQETPIADIERSVYANAYALFNAMTEHLPDSVIDHTPMYSRHLCFPTNPMFKGVWNTSIADASDDDIDASIDDVIAWFSERNAPFFFWWTDPQTQPRNLGERLLRKGLISMEQQSRELAKGLVQAATGAPGMIADLHRMNEATLDTVPSDFEIDIVDNDAALIEFKDVFIDAFGIPEFAGQAWVDATRTIGIGKTPWQMYVGRRDGIPVATTLLFCGAGVASVYAVATINEERGLGLGSAITLRPLLDARNAGYNHAVLFSSEMGIHAYERIGFKLTDVRIDRYLWRKQ